MIMMMAVIFVMLGQQTQQDEASLEADRETDPFPCRLVGVRTQTVSELTLSVLDGPSCMGCRPTYGRCPT
jgi:hypothetical protein